MQPKISVFENVNPTSFKGHFSVEEVLRTIRSERFKPQTLHLRSLIDEQAARIYKAGRQDEQSRLVEPGHFFGVTWCGIFEGGRSRETLVEHSRFLCMDIDGLSPKRLSVLLQHLRDDPYTFVLFISPSGNGLKWVVRINLESPDEYRCFFDQMSDYLHSSYKLTRKEDVEKGVKPEIDPSCKNVDRLCFLPYAPDAVHNPDCLIIPLLDEYRPQRKQEKTIYNPPVESSPMEVIEDKTLRLVNDCIIQLQLRKIDLTDSYESWIEIGFAFASLGEGGRTFFHKVSQLNVKYTYQEADAKFTELLKSRNGTITIGTFLLHCEKVMGKVWETPARHDRFSKIDDQAEQEWKTPTPFASTLLSVLSVSHTMLPEQLRPWLIDISNRMKCPLDFVASAAVVMLSSLIGTRLSIKPKSFDDWTITPNLWGAAIGDPSSMKTPSVAEVFKPLNRIIVETRKQYEDDMRCYEAELVTYEAQKKVYSSQELERLKGKKLTNPVGFPEPIQKPTERRYMTNDATVEKLADLLNENPTGVLQFRDELTGLLAGWDRSGREEDRAFYLEAWNGNGSKTVDRIGRGTIHVKNLCVSLFGGIQPQKLLGYLRAATEFDNDGFVQRLQLSVYPDRPQWEYVDEYPDKQARDTAYTLIKQIVVSDFSTIAYSADDHTRYPYTRFDEEAQDVFKQWLIDWETNVLPNESGLLLEHFTKYRSLIPSLALIFHVVNTINKPVPSDRSKKYLVSKSAVQMAVEWGRYLQSHARRIYGLLDTQQVEAAKALLTRLKAGHLKNGFKAHDVLRKGWANLIKLDSVEAALEELVTHNWLLEVHPPLPSVKGGRPESAHYLIHPTISLKV